MNMKKILAVLLAAAMLLGLLAGCGGSGSEESAEATPAADVPPEEEVAQEPTYTFHEKWATGGINTWSPTDWENSNEADIQGYTSSVFYEFMMNEDKDGYDIWPVAASEMPIDVTADYAGNETYGVPADATEGYAWQINLNPDMCWENGEPINADTYLYSMQQYLNPEMKNYRASSFYEGTAGLANAKQYYNGGGMMHLDACDTVGYDVPLEEAGEVYINTAESCYWWGESMEAAYNEGYADYFILSDGTDFLEKYENGVDILVDEELYADLQDLCEIGGDVPENWIEFCFTLEESEAIDFDQVGIVKNDDYSITLILTNPITPFFACYGLGITPIYEPMYEELKQDTGDIVKSTYGTSADKWISCGPFKLTTYQADKHIVFERNENWFGYNDPRYEGLYQTTGIDVEFVDDPATRLNLFLQGNSDYVSLRTEDMELYGNSDYAYYSPLSYTWVLSFNTDPEMLATEDTDTACHSILQLQDFRHAISLSLDRVGFSQTVAASEPGYGLLNYVYICDPDTGELYRDSEYAKQALCELYGVEDESQITGYDKQAAAELFQAAYDEAIADGIMTENQTVELDFHCWEDTKLYQDWTNFIQAAINDATVGTSLEGKVTVNLVVVEDVYTDCENGLADMACTSWGGADMDPYSMMQCYTDPAYNLVYGYDGTTHQITINVNGEDITMSAYDWYQELCMGEYAVADLDTRNQILAGIEKGVLEWYGQVVLFYDVSAGMYSQRVIPGSEEYINSLVGFGGTAFMTYTMDDAEWAEYCASQNNNLTY